MTDISKDTSKTGQWLCTQCKCPVEEDCVQATYLDSSFAVSLFTCPKCSLALVPKSVCEALGELEHAIEKERMLQKT